MLQLEAIENRIIAAAAKAGRGDFVTLVAVSKQQPDHLIDAALKKGLRVFGENRVQDAQLRWAARKQQQPGIKLHLIGGLQTNKVKQAVALFDMIETVDSEKLAASLAAEMKKQQRSLPCLIQVNTGNEPQKNGIAIDALPALLAFCRAQGLNIQGLMCIPPADQPPQPHFDILARLAKSHDLPILSMGMSSDFETAIACGATQVRVGSALFGGRHTHEAV